MTRKDYEKAAEIVQTYVQPYDAVGECIVDAFAEFFSVDNPRFDVARFRAACIPGANVKARPTKAKAIEHTSQPKTGAKCSCRRGVERDNCLSCEGTGQVSDFAAIRARA